MTDRLHTYAAILALPDPPDLPVRGHRQTYPAIPWKREQTFKAVVAWHLADRRGHHAAIVRPAVRLVRRRA